MNLPEDLLEMTHLLQPRLLIELERNMGALRQPPHCVQKGNAFILLHERKDIASFMAAETVKYLPVRIDMEAGAFLFVKGTKGDEICARSFQREIPAYDIHHIAGRANLFKSCRSDESSHALKMGKGAAIFQALHKHFSREL